MKKEEKEVEYTIKYSEEEIKLIGDDKRKMLLAKDQRESPHDELDGMSYSQYFESNEKGANTFIEPKKDKYDNNFQSGTIRSKMMALLSAINNLNLSPDISAYDTDNFEIAKLGNAVEQIIYKTEEIEIYEEKKILIQWELLKHGDVYVEEVLVDKTSLKRILNKKFDGKIATEWTEKIVELPAMPERNLISGLGVFLGDIRQPDFAKQPFVFTVEVMPYSEAEIIFGKWKRWKYVPKKIVRNTDIQDDITYGWNITDVDKDEVEVIRKQERSASGNTYTIYINGILMTPVGLPFLWKWDGYNIASQGLEPISSHFAYHKSIVSRLKSNVAIYDEIMRLAVLLTQKAAEPPRANLTGRILSTKIFMPRNITSGINPNQVPLMDANAQQGVTGPIMTMIDKLERTNDFNSVSPQFQGQRQGGEMTATESLQLKEQAKASLGIIVNMAALLEFKLAWLRLFNILENWFNPVDTVLDEVRNVLKNKYRTVTREVPIEGSGIGNMMVRPTDEDVSPEDLYNEEESLEESTGKPTRIISLNLKELNWAKIIWQIVVRPREKMTSELNKLLTERYLQGLFSYFGSSVNIGQAQEDYAAAWEKDPIKTFSQQEQPQLNNIPSAGNTATQTPEVPQMQNILKNNAVKK